MKPNSRISFVNSCLLFTQVDMPLPPALPLPLPLVVVISTALISFILSFFSPNNFEQTPKKRKHFFRLGKQKVKIKVI